MPTCSKCNRSEKLVAGELFPLQTHKCSHCSANSNVPVRICSDCFFSKEHWKSYKKFYKIVIPCHIASVSFPDKERK